MMKGVQFLVDEKGEAQAVVISLKKHRKLWEDFQDLLVSESRKDEPSIPFEDVKKQLRARGIIR